MPLGLGELCALLSPMAWSVAVVLFKRSGAAPPLSLNLFKNVLALVLLTVTLPVLGVGIPVDRPWQDWARLAASGLLGLAVADTLLFAGLARIGAARLAIVDTTYAPMVVLLSALFLGEHLTVPFLVGAAAVVAGVFTASYERSAHAASPRSVRVGVLFAFCAINGTAIGVVIAKPVLEHAHLVEVTWTRLVFGVLGQVVYITLARRWSEALVAFRPGPLWRPLLPGAFLGTYVSLLLWLGGFKWADASVAAVLNQLATVYLLALAWLVLREPLQRRQVVGATLAAVGATVVVLAGR